ncbi:phage tail spike protein [Virgibacillus pantothenticus]|uniref:phage tail spike protein n=1 Tax=Virgibacillus pantothenticus TaxID=1473 RepID=UPI002DB9BC40|nr:phage tail spike protein [Virgibacillus pantothenticus]MEB5458104.1 phage tail spike protein [Virgibacillus pantothenticus]MEB5466291.1 phage tail spike protein [Virgibacillus pantothenticus]MEB5470688.1 phage tail spike protein [Virgibacillus pantothenticus]
MKEKIFVFDKYDNLLAITNNYIKAEFEETVEMPVSFLIEFPVADDDAKYLVGGNQVAFRDLKGDFRLFTIREVDDQDGEATEKLVHCMPGIQELTDVMVEERRPQDKTAAYVLGLILENSRWQVGKVADLGKNSTSFYFKNAYECLGELTKIWGGEAVDRVEIKGNKIAGRYVDIVHRKGSDTGKRFEMDKDIKNITRTVLYYPKTALYGKGKSLETENEGHTRKITFRDVVWSKKKGDPVDKPKGQEWVGDPEALEKHGVPNHETGKLMHRFGLFEDNDEENPERLLAKTWQAVQDEKDPKVQYKMDIITFYGIADYEHEQVFLGDTGIARDKGIKPMILVEARIMSWKYDIGNPRDGSLVLGNILDLHPDNSKIEWVVDKVKENAGNWDAGGGPITDKKFPDIKPAVPKNFKAEGLFQTVMLSWTFESTYAIAAYEIYASQMNGFAPDKTNLLFRGKVGGYNHKVNTDEKWYYRIRAVNTHGTPSDYSEQVSASTVQLDLPDIEDIVPDFIEYGIYKGDKAPSPKDYKYWLDTSKEPNILRHWNSEAWKPLAPTNAGDIGAVSLANYQEQVGKIVSDLANKVDLEWINGQLVSKANKDDVYTIEQLDNKFNNVVSKTTYESDKEGIIKDLENHESRISQTETDIKSKVSNTQYKQDKQSLETSIKENKSSIEQNAKMIASKVSNEQYKTDKEGIIKEIAQNKSSIVQNAESIRSKVDATYVKGELGKIEIGGRNLFVIKDALVNSVFKWADGEVATETDSLVSGFIEVLANENIICNYTISQIMFYDKDKVYIGTYRDGELVPVGGQTRPTNKITIPNKQSIAYMRVSFRDGFLRGASVEGKKVKLEKGNKATDWTPAPEDVEDKINNIQIGGRNLVAKIDVIGWSDGYTFDNYVYRIINKKSAGLRINHDILEPKTEYVMSFRIKKIDGSIKTLGGHMHDMEFMKVYMDGEYVSDNWSSGAMVQYSDDDNEHKVIVHFKTTGTVTDDFYIQPNRASGYAYNYSAEVWDLKVEKGNKATDWTPAPEDTQAKIQSVEHYASEIEQTAKGVEQNFSAIKTDYETFKNTANSTFKKQADLIEGKVSETTYNADMDNMTMRVSTAESTIKQHADRIEAKVSKNGVVSSINQSPEQIKISAARVSIDGDLVVKNGKVYIKDGVITNSLIAGDAKIDFAKIANVKVTNAMISSLSADKIGAGILDANKVLIRVKNGTQAIQIDDKGFQSVDSKGKVRIFIGVRDIAGKGQSDPATIIFYGGKGGAAGSIGSNVNDDLIIGSKNGALQFDVKKNMLYYAQEHRFVSNNNRRYWRLTTIKNSEGQIHPSFKADASGWGYLGGEFTRLKRVYTNYLHYYKTIKLSTRERKENIQDLLPETAQQIFNQICLKKYHYKNDDDLSSMRKESYGPISEESPDEILDIDGKSLDQDNYINVIAGALKYQQQRIDELEKIIKGESQDGTGS